MIGQIKYFPYLHDDSLFSVCFCEFKKEKNKGFKLASKPLK